MRLYINYRQLNNIIIKNYYTLSLISELHDYIYEAKWFITLNLRRAYNLIRMKKEEK